MALHLGLLKPPPVITNSTYTMAPHALQRLKRRMSNVAEKLKLKLGIADPPCRESTLDSTETGAATVSTLAVPTGRPFLGSAEVHVPCSPFVGSEDLAGLATLSTPTAQARAWVYSPSVYSRPASWEYDGSPPTPPPTQGRRPTLADYQLGLTLAGDSRRRPSTSSAMGLASIAELEALRGDDRKLSKVNAMDEAGDTVMGKAMKRHIDEKALFRSESKRRESAAQPLPVFTSPSFGGSGVPAVTEEEEDEAVAEEQEEIPATPGEHQLNTRAPGRASSMHEYSSPQREHYSPVDYFPDEPTNIISTKVSERTPVSSHSKKKSKIPRIGTCLPSWTKFPSHTRPDRSASASTLDNVITRDFAVDIEAAESQSAATSPKGKKSRLTSSKSAKSLIRSPSRAYDGFIAYYTDLLTRAGFHGQNRRTSVAMSQGTLLNPELEMIAPVTGSEGHVHSYQHLLEIEQHLEQVSSRTEPSGELFRQDSFKSFHFKQHVTTPEDTVEEEQDPLGP
ncbi:hypothetical protein CLAFUW4_13854 [Fulvia fulva]|uniref:Uncharacterized protein n=1 Tax=Passalora fulva TaxID=5499 RepID=A0A9Q8PL82_PASFU|nr:uncharacterized protein CLAFUR5_13699 [Fulvia fulva]UJO24538.1 hypothetical protein CLAFUR5_13699 [Fulvia fulva]WPV21701.1 hypothetical protein CLAFUW4_13854 [Fulvia fulva]WPV36638.1 hypothetical protein CLAFUW7_13862 [Fulvia fulva]